MWLYSVIVVFSIVIPLSLSFEHHLNFYRRWRVVLPAILIVYLFYIAIDIGFTQLKIWGFGSHYNINYYLFNLPVEEWLFIFFIPYSAMFIYDASRCCWPKLRLRRKYSKVICFVSILFLIPILFSNLDKIYTTFVLVLLIASLTWAMFYYRNIIGRFFLTYLLMLGPFIIINSLLTGTYIGKEIVWYNESAITGIRLLTIPIEDFGYMFSFVLFTLLVRQTLIEHNFLASSNLNEELDENPNAIYSLDKIIH